MNTDEEQVARTFYSESGTDFSALANGAAWDITRWFLTTVHWDQDLIRVTVVPLLVFLAANFRSDVQALARFIRVHPWLPSVFICG